MYQQYEFTTTYRNYLFVNSEFFIYKESCTRRYFQEERNQKSVFNSKSGYHHSRNEKRSYPLDLTL